MKIESRMQHSFKCKCHVSVDVRVPNSQTYCSNCGEIYNVESATYGPTEENPSGLVVTDTNRSVYVYALTAIMPTEHPVFFLMKMYNGMKGREVDRRTVRYRIEEHDCPTDLISDVLAMYYKEDSDPHGVFELVHVMQDEPDWDWPGKEPLLKLNAKDLEKYIVGCLNSEERGKTNLIHRSRYE